MASLCVLVLLVAASSVVQGHENIAAVVNQMSLLEKEINQLKVELNHLKSDVPGLETRVINKMDILELLLRSDLTEKIVPSYMRSQIESFDATVNSHVMSQIKHLKRGYQQMKRQTLSLTRQLGDTVKDKDACERQVSELKTEWNRTRHHETHVEKEVSLLKDHVLLVKRQSTDMQAQINETQRSVETLVKQNVRLRNDLIVINASHAEDVQTLGDFHLNYVNRTQPIPYNTPTTQPGRPFTSVATTPTTQQFQDKTRILVVQYNSGPLQHPYQITIDKNDMKTYPYLHTSHVDAVTYEPVSRRLIFSRYSPDGIFSSRLDVSGVTTLREGIRSLGMAVDVDRQLIFLTTYDPTYTISRMSTFGKHFRGIVDLYNHGTDIPHAIAVDSRKKVIYFCKDDYGLWSVDYDGNRLHQIDVRREVIAATIDTIHNVLYFSDNKKVMKRSLSTNTTTEMLEFSDWIISLVYYNNSLYISGKNIDVIYLENNVQFNLKTMKYGDNVMCLIP